MRIDGDIFEKLNLGSRQEIVVLDAPASFAAGVGEAAGDHDPPPSGIGGGGGFLAGVCDAQERGGAACAADREAAPRATRLCGSLIPRARRKNTPATSIVTRGGTSLKKLGFDTVRAVAIDDGLDGTALSAERVYQAGLAELAEGVQVWRPARQPAGGRRYKQHPLQLERIEKIETKRRRMQNIEEIATGTE